MVVVVLRQLLLNVTNTSMQYGICNLSIVPLRLEASDASELVSQVLYGDFLKYLNSEKSGVTFV